MNKAMLIGNLTRDPEVKTVGQNNDKVVNFGLATNKKWRDKNGNQQERVEFHNIEAWGKTAEVIEQYVKKGNKLYVEGELYTQSWDDQETGNKRYKTIIRAFAIELLTPKSQNDGGQSQGQPSQPQQNQPAPNQPSYNSQGPSEEPPF